MRVRFYSSSRPAFLLDRRRPRRHNDGVRIRLVLIAVAFAVLALAGLRGDDARAIEPHGTASVLAAQPAADVDPPAIIRAAVTTPAAPQTHFDLEAGLRDACAVLDAAAAAPRVPADPAYDSSRPRTFPLLI